MFERDFTLLLHHGNDVKAHLNVQFAPLHIIVYGLNEQPDFFGVDKILRQPERCGTSGFDFHNSEHATFPDNQVYFSLAADPVGFQDLVAFVAQECRCELFAFFAEFVVGCHVG